MYNFISIDFAGYSSLRVKQFENELYFPIDSRDFMKYLSPESQSVFKIYTSECVNYIDALDISTTYNFDLNLLSELAKYLAKLVKTDIPKSKVTYCVSTNGLLSMKEMVIEN